MPNALPLLFLFVALGAHAQTIQIDNVRLDLAARDSAAQTVPVSFDVAWDAAWRDGDRWGAAWVFAKFEREPGVWADLRFSVDGADADADGWTVAPSVLPAGHASGLLVHRSEDGPGAARVTVRARWAYGASYYALPSEGVAIRVLGVEMVHVAGGAFEVGDAAAGGPRQPNAFRAEECGRFRIASEAELPVGEPGGLFYDVPEGEGYAGGDVGGPIPAAFPKGTAPFYVMRTAVTQGQYADFLSLLPPRARASRDVTTYPGYTAKGGTIACDATACQAARPERAANFLSWADGIGWASWAGLRPMTEFEYEKAAAGTPADSSRYADGDLPDSAGASARASVWGALDLRGGLWERVVSPGTAEGRAFQGSPGQGFVDDLGHPYGFANADWPGPRALGTGYRGGTEGLLDLSEVADRTYGAYEATYGNEGQGFRAVLSIPR